MDELSPSRRYYLRHREEIIAKNRAYYEQHKETYKAYLKNYYQQNKAQINARNAAAKRAYRQRQQIPTPAPAVQPLDVPTAPATPSEFQVRWD